MSEVLKDCRNGNDLSITASLKIHLTRNVKDILRFTSV